MNPVMLKPITHLILLLLIIPVGLSAQNARFYMESDRDKIQIGETVALTATLENINSNTIAMPDFSPFKIVSGPSKSSSISIINGKKTSSIAYQYILMATEAGKIKISPASAKIGSKDIFSNELTIEVTTGNIAAAFAEDVTGDINLRLEISSTTGYIGQQLVLDYAIYTRENIASYDFLNQPQEDGFYILPINNVRERAQVKTIKGVPYNYQVVARQVLFPQKTGTYTIGPINIRANIPVNNGGSSFFFREYKPVTITSNTLKINIAALPEPQPENYCGAVGDTQIKANLQKGTVHVGQAIVLNVEIEGKGDPKTTIAPKMNIPEGLEAYEPSLIIDESKQINTGVLVHKKYEYIFIPKEPKIYTLNPELSYFDPEKKAYQTVSAGSFTVNVTEGDATDSKPITLSKEGLSDINENYKVYNLEQYRWKTPLYVSSILGITLLTLGGLFYKKKKAQHVDTQLANFNKAESVAQRHLAKAAEYKSNQDFKAFYEEIASATTGYVIKKYAIPHSEASVNNIVRWLTTKGVSQELIDHYQWIHKQAELARFAGTFGDMDEVYTTASQFIAGMMA